MVHTIAILIFELNFFFNIVTCNQQDLNRE